MGFLDSSRRKLFELSHTRRSNFLGCSRNNATVAFIAHKNRKKKVSFKELSKKRTT